jgi:hypothetical protein
MSKRQTRDIGRKRREGNTNFQRANSNIIEDLMESEGKESPVADLRRMMRRMFNELKEEFKENVQKKLSTNIKRTQIKNLNRYRYNYELREDFNKQQIKLRRLQKGGI